MKTRSILLALLFSILGSGSYLYAEQQRVAIIGGGASGLATAWLLDEDYQVTIFESNYRLGGHADTIEIDVGGAVVPIEAGFEFIAPKYFPRFCRLLNNILNVPLKEYTLTSTFYRTDDERYIQLPPIADCRVNWHSFSPGNIFNMIELVVLFGKAERIVEIRDVDITLQDFLANLCLTEGFIDEFLYPFLASNWGVTKEQIKTFSAYDTLKYLIEGEKAEHYQWFEIQGGTQKYIQALAAQLENATICLKTEIAGITYADNVYTVQEANGQVSTFDHLVIATNAKQASQLFVGIPEVADVQSILSTFKYYKTTIAIHGDTRFMPPQLGQWGVVNMRYDGVNSAITVHKSWLSPSSPVFKSWITYDVRAPHDQGNPLPDPLYALIEYQHPVIDLTYFEAQAAIKMLQGKHHLWIAGNYTYDNDSHESAIMSAVLIAQQLAAHSSRLECLMIEP